MTLPANTYTQRLVSLQDAAAYADVSTRTIRRYIADGRLRAFRLGPRLIKIGLADLDRLAAPVPAGLIGSRGPRPADFESGDAA
jgi:excisionase family DNA binding protein